jgi:predicted dehydrogenase
MPFYPGAQRVARWIEEERFGRVIEVRTAFLHSSDLDPAKPINWKRRAETNGASGVLNDLGMHALHLPLRAGWKPAGVHAVLSNIVEYREDGAGDRVPCDTWDNASLLCRVDQGDHDFPMHLAVKRIAPGETNTWSIEIDGTEGSTRFSTKHPKTLRTMAYTSGAEQSFAVTDLGYVSAFPTITGPIFEFGFSDAVLQMWAAFVDELVHGEAKKGPFGCATPEEAATSHAVWAAAMESHANGVGVRIH